jgi:sugar lactone lactonase YvrE
VADGVRRLQAARVSERVAELGESPVWEEREQVLRWIDGPAGLVHGWSPASGELRPIDLGEEVAAVGLRGDGGLLVVHRRRLALRGPDGDFAPPPLAADERLNDGAADRFGTYWVGSVQDEGGGHLYRVHPDGRVETTLDGIGMSNGIDWSPDGRTMYYVDTRTQRVDRLTVDPADGSVSARRPFVEIPPELGLPDGLAVDAEGGVWLAIWGAAEVHRFLPDGSLDAVVEVPASNSSSCAFGGAELRTLFITSAADSSSSSTDAGGLFAVEVPVRGHPPNRFAG